MKYTIWMHFANWGYVFDSPKIIEYSADTEPDICAIVEHFYITSNHIYYAHYAGDYSNAMVHPRPYDSLSST